MRTIIALVALAVAAGGYALSQPRQDLPMAAGPATATDSFLFRRNGQAHRGLLRDFMVPGPAGPAGQSIKGDKGDRGDLPDAMQMAVAALPESQQFPAQMLLSSATTYERAHPLVPMLGAILSYDAGELDDLWRDAAAL